MSGRRVLQDLGAAAGIVGLVAGLAAWGRGKSTPPAPPTGEFRLADADLRMPSPRTDTNKATEFTFRWDSVRYFRPYKGFIATPAPTPNFPECSNGERGLVDHP